MLLMQCLLNMYLFTVFLHPCQEHSNSENGGREEVVTYLKNGGVHLLEILRN